MALLAQHVLNRISPTSANRFYMINNVTRTSTMPDHGEYALLK